MTKSAVLYARLSVSAEESVSTERQLDAGRRYCQSRGWFVVGEFVDDGVSATRTTPAKRKGWGALLATDTAYDVAVCWKLDRLARRPGDFDAAVSDLRERNATFVSVEESLDLTTPTGEAMANIIATFARLEAATTAQRVRAAREYLASNDSARFAVVGRPAPYGYRVVEREADGRKVLAVHPDEWPWLADAAAMILDGHTVYAACQMLDRMNAPLPRISQGSRTGSKWSHTSLERMLRNPVVAGMIPSNPGRQKDDNLRHGRDIKVLTDADGMPVVNTELAILTTAEHRDLVLRLDVKESPAARPRASRAATSPLLSRLVTCGECDGGWMARGSLRGRPTLKCSGCHQTISRAQLDPHIVERLLAEQGGQHTVEMRPQDPDAADLGDVEAAIATTTAAMGADGADMAALVARLDGLKAIRAKTRTNTSWLPRFTITTQTVSEAWEEAEDDLARREILAGRVESLSIVKGGLGRNLDPARVRIVWRTSQATA